MKTKEELMADYNVTDRRLEGKTRTLTEIEASLLDLSNLLRPFLEVLADIRDILKDISDDQPSYNERLWKVT